MVWKRSLRKYVVVLSISFLMFVLLFHISVLNKSIEVQSGFFFEEAQRKRLEIANEKKADVEQKHRKAMETIFAFRRKRIRDACVLDDRGAVRNLMLYKPANLSYCIVPKAGCTFWKRIFRFLNGDTGGKNISSPFEINRMMTHYGSYKHMGNIRFDSQDGRHKISSTNRLLIARDPYSRLWAVYLDKFFLPDFWRTHGQIIYRHRLKVRHDKKKKRKQKKVCASDLTFEEFIRYVVSVESKLAVSNEHWNPITKLCNPCQYNPDYVVTMETFSRDSKYILEKSGLSWVLKNQPESHTEDELEMLVKYNFDLIRSKFYKSCLNGVTLSKRLWKVFQMNGFISPKSKFPEIIGFRPELATKELFMSEVLKKVREYTVNKATKLKLKQKAMEAAYRKLPSSLVRMIPYIYANDFRLFGYQAYPPAIFKGYKQSKKNT